MLCDDELCQDTKKYWWLHFTCSCAASWHSGRTSLSVSQIFRFIMFCSVFKQTESTNVSPHDYLRPQGYLSWKIRCNHSSVNVFFFKDRFQLLMRLFTHAHLWALWPTYISASLKQTWSHVSFRSIERLQKNSRTTQGLTQHV